MKSKRYNLVILVLLMAMVAIGVWWFTRPKAVVPEKMVAAIAPVKADVTKVVAPSAQVALPKVPAVAAGGRAIVDDSPITSDPQADLKTVIPDLARLYGTGDLLEEYEMYTPPDKLDPAMIQRFQTLQQQMAGFAAQDPRMQEEEQQAHNAAARSWEALETQTPTYNAAGDEATYVYTPSDYLASTHSYPITFVKISGKWYMKPADNSGGTMTFGRSSG